MQPTAHPSVLPRGLAFQQVFSTRGVLPFDEVAWEVRDVAIYRDGSKGSAPLDTRRPGESDASCPEWGAEQVLLNGACGTCSRCGASQGCG